MAGSTQLAPTGGFRPWAVGLMQMAGGGLEILLGAGRVATPTGRRTNHDSAPVHRGSEPAFCRGVPTPAAVCSDAPSFVAAPDAPCCLKLRCTWPLWMLRKPAMEVSAPCAIKTREVPGASILRRASAQAS